MVLKFKAEGYEEFKTVIQKIEAEHKSKEIFVLFSGSKDSTGQSWCPDCVEGRHLNKFFKF